MKKRVLALSGKRFSGKDALAAMLASRTAARGVRLATHAFAAESKRLFAAREPRVEVDKLLGDRAYKERWRPALTTFTVESLAADPLVFCRSVADRIAASPDAALVTDVRLRVEVLHLRERFDVVLVRLARSDAARASSGWSFVASVDGHHTETELDDPSSWDVVVDNDGTLDDLGARADALVTRLLGPA
jgi:phosphomevalonate kinase